MGLSNAIAGGIMMISFVLVMSIIPDILNDSATLSQAASARADIENSSARTSVEVQSMTQVSSDKIQIVSINDGMTKLSQYEDFSALITYDANRTSTGVPIDVCLPPLCTFQKVRVTEQLSYAGKGSAAELTMDAGTWVVYSFDSSLDQHVDPQIVNPGEEFTLRLRTAERIWTDGTDTLIYCTLATDSGVVISKEAVF